VEQDVYTLVLLPGEHHEIEVRILPTRRPIRPLGELAPPVSIVSPP
jgi:hypothetical protein